MSATASSRLSKSTGGTRPGGRRRPPSYQRPERIRGIQGDDITLDKLVLNGKGVKANIVEAILEATIDRTIEGASTLTLRIADDKRELIRSGIAKARSTCEIDDLKFSLAKIGKTGNELALTFEDHAIAKLRLDKKPRKASRSKMTRAKFVRALIRECNKKHGTKIRLYSPELKKKQPIGKSRDSAKSSEREDTEGGLSKNSPGTVKGADASAYQIKTIETVIDVGESMNAPIKLIQTAVVTIITESQARNLPGGDRDSVGAFQQRNMGPWNKRNRRDVAAAAKTFYEVGIEEYRKNPNRDIDSLAQAIQRSGVPTGYTPWKKEAKAWVAEYGASGGSGGGASGGGRTRVKRYFFTRGQGRKRESSWTAIKRLADEVQWRAFMVHNTFYFISEADLMKGRSRYTLNEESTGVDWIDFDFDVGKKASTCTVACRGSRWAAPPGTVVTITDMGPANGRWLVQSISRSLFSVDATITLKKPMRELPEPSPETEEVSDDSAGGDGGGSGGGNSGFVNAKVARLYDKLKSISDKNMPYVWGGGHSRIGVADGGTGRDKGIGFDCSGYISAGLGAAGLLDAPMASGGFMNWGEPGPGRYFTVYANAGHMFLHFYGSAPMKRADTSRVQTGPSDNKAGPHLRKSHRSTGGFVARHYPGL